MEILIALILLIILYFLLKNNITTEIEKGECPKCKSKLKYVNSGKYKKYYCPNCTWTKEYVNGIEIKIKDNYEKNEKNKKNRRGNKKF